MQKYWYWIIITIIFFLLFSWACNELSTERAEKNRIAKLYQGSKARIENYQRAIDKLENKLKRSESTITKLEGIMSGTTAGIATAIGAGRRTNDILERMETIVRELAAAD